MLAVHRLRDLRIDPIARPRGRTYLSAASGLVPVGEQLYVVADDEHYLAVFDARSPEAPGRLLRLFEGGLPASPKKRKAQKPDIGSLTLLPAMRSDTGEPSPTALRLCRHQGCTRDRPIAWACASGGRGPPPSAHRP